MSGTTEVSLEEQIGYLTDVREIEQLKYQYAAYADKNDGKGVASLFAEDGRWVFERLGAEHIGRDAIERWFERLAEYTLWAAHLVIAPRVQLADDRQSATGQFYLLGLVTAGKPGNPDEADAAVLNAIYTDQFVKQDGRWYFKEINGNQFWTADWTEGWVAQPWRGRGHGNNPWE